MADLSNTTVRGNLNISGTVRANRIEVPNSASTVTLSTSWTEDSTNGCVYQDVSVTGVLVTDCPVLALASSVNAATSKTEESEWGKIYKATVIARNKIRFYARSATTSAISVLVRR